MNTTVENIQTATSSVSPVNTNTMTTEVAAAPKAPRLFEYLDYRAYLKDFYVFKKATSPSFSLAFFANRAGIQTRNYLKRVIDGERPVSVDLIPKFCRGLGLDGDERMYFEALVHFNQTKDDETKRHYFNSLKNAARGHKGSAIEIASDQLDVLSKWWILPIREMVNMKDFVEDAGQIAKTLKNKISKKDAQAALDLLLRLGMLVRDQSTGRLKQSNPVLRYSADVVNMVVRDYHYQTMDRTKEALAEDPFESWNVRSLSISVPLSETANVHKAVNNFVHELNTKLSSACEQSPAPVCDAVIQMNIQVIQLTK